ncbi:unnamed protein product, partial [Heterosigma akashiwo]
TAQAEERQSEDSSTPTANLGLADRCPLAICISPQHPDKGEVVAQIYIFDILL